MPSWVPSGEIEDRYTTPPLGSGVKRPGSRPAISTLRLASMIICSAIRPAHGPSHSEQAPTSSTTGTTSISSGRSSRLGPTPMAVMTAISESR